MTSIVATDATWQTLELTWDGGVINAEPSGWHDFGFDDSAWDAGVVPVDPSAFWYNMASADFLTSASRANSRLKSAVWITRMEFTLAADLTNGAALRVTTDDWCEVWLDDVLVAELDQLDTNFASATAVAIPAASLLTGDHCIAVKVHNSDVLNTWSNPTMVQLDLVPTEAGGLVAWDGETWVPERIKEWTIQRGASAELTGGTNPGSATIVLINTPDDRYNPENAGGDLYGFLQDGPRVWLGVNEDGTITPDEDKAVYGLFAGHITELSLLPEGGAAVAPLAELVCADPLEWYNRRRVRIPDALGRSQAALRLLVLNELGVVGPDLPAEPTTLPLSGADGDGLAVLDDLNRANGTRHFAKPADNTADWYTYTAIRRVDRLDGTAEADLDAGADHVTGTDGFRVSADGVINQQKATVLPVDLSALREVWQAPELPLTVVGEVEVFTEFDDFVSEPLVDVAYTGSALTTAIEAFGSSAKVTLTSAGTSVLAHFSVQGYASKRGIGVSFEANDLVSQATPRGIRAGSELSGDLLGSLTSAQGFAEHIVWRFGNHLYRPTLTVVNWLPEMFDLDLFDRISLTVAELSIADRIFDIVGLTLHCDLAALDADDNPVVHHTATYVLQESRVQEPTQWFTTDVSTSDGPDVLAY